MPARRVASSASSIFFSASSRVSAVTISLASMGSYQAGTSVPRSTQLSTRASVGNTTSVSRPALGWKFFAGSSAYSRT